MREAGGAFDTANEIDDLAAVIEHAGGHAHLFGHSSGGILVLEGAMRGLPVDSVAVYEPPFRADPDLPHPPADFLDRITTLADKGDRDGAASLFFSEAIGLPPEIVSGMKHGPVWAFFLDKALTLPYDVSFSRPSELVDRDRLAALRMPVLAVYGDKTSPEPDGRREGRGRLGARRAAGRAARRGPRRAPASRGAGADADRVLRLSPFFG